MLKYEFEKLIGKEVSTEDYGVIDYVYTWHPIVPDVGGKKQIADLYKIGGMLLMRDMYSSATKAREYHEKMEILRRQKEEIEQRMEDLKKEFHDWIK